MTHDYLKDLKVNYLIKVKQIINSEGFTIVDRSKNLMSISKMNLTLEDIKKCLLSLTVQNYTKGPEKDYDINKKRMHM